VGEQSLGVRHGPPSGLLGRTAEVLRMVKIEHSLFALPFAFLGMLLAARGVPDLWTLLWVVVCMVSARAAAMVFNRILDRGLDARNPRTRNRSLPAGRLGLPFAWAFTAGSAAVFVLGAGMLNQACLLLSPLALAVVLGYSTVKRFSALTHLVLGVALALAPAGGWIAVRADFGLEPLLLCLAVALWVAGFDILYACQDVEFDREAGVHSLPAALGVGAAMAWSAVLHLAMLLLLAGLGRRADLGWIYVLGVAVAGLLLGYAHWIVRPGDLRRIETAFFTSNALLGLVLLAATFLDLTFAARAV